MTGILNDAMFKYSLHIFRETMLHRKYQLPKYHDVQLLHISIVPSKLTIIADCKYQ